MKEINIDPADPDSLPYCLTVAEAAGFVRCSQSMILNQIRTGALPARRSGRRIILVRPELLAWLTEKPAQAPFLRIATAAAAPTEPERRRRAAGSRR